VDSPEQTASSPAPQFILQNAYIAGGAVTTAHFLRLRRTTFTPLFAAALFAPAAFAASDPPSILGHAASVAARPHHQASAGVFMAHAAALRPLEQRTAAPTVSDAIAATGTAYMARADGPRKLTYSLTRTVPGRRAKILADGFAAAPADAPIAVQQAIWAGNQLIGRPYVYGGGHGSFISSGYDCSGTVSFALRGGDLITAPADSSQFMDWGSAGHGHWMTIYTNPAHAFIEIAGIRLDTSAAGDPNGLSGPQWRPLLHALDGYVVRHPTDY
jgi:cell wall-associated NlpC family hydrolase